MITSVSFKNFKALRDTTLPLGRCTILVGPNGSGKSTALNALATVHDRTKFRWKDIVSAQERSNEQAVVEVHVRWEIDGRGDSLRFCWNSSGNATRESILASARSDEDKLQRDLERMRVYSLEPRAIESSMAVSPGAAIGTDGAGVVFVLSNMKDDDPSRFEELERQLSFWLPEFSGIKFSWTPQNERSFALRRKVGGELIPARELSYGTACVLALLTIAYMPSAPSIIGLEEPDRGIHPRMMRHVQDAIYHLCFPEEHKEDRDPVQVIATTHSPYFLDVFKEHPEEIVIAEKSDNGVRFARLSDKPYLEEILGDAPLGDIWYSGILGGVPVES